MKKVRKITTNMPKKIEKNTKSLKIINVKKWDIVEYKMGITDKPIFFQTFKTWKLMTNQSIKKHGNTEMSVI